MYFNHSKLLVFMVLLFLIKCDLIINEILSNIFNNCDCDILKNTLFWEVYKNNFGKYKEVIIVKLSNENSSYFEIYNEVVSHIMHLNIHPVRFEILNYKKVTDIRYIDTFYWNGEKIPLEPNVTIDYNDIPVQNVVKNLLIIVENEDLLQLYTEGVRRYPFFAPMSQFIVIITKNATNDSDVTVKSMLVKLWNHYGIKNVLIFTCFGGLNDFYWYDPFGKENGTYGLVQKGIDHNHHLITRKVTDYNGYPLRLSAFHRYPTALVNKINDTKINNKTETAYEMKGLDAVVFKNLASDLNLTARVIISSKERYGFKDDTTQIFLGSAGDILYHQADININSRFVKYYDSYEIGFVHPILTDQMCVVVPKSQEIPQWRALFHCFKNTVWMTLALLNILCGCIWYGIKLLCKYFIAKDRKLKGFEKIQYNMFILMTSGPVTYLGNNAAEQVFIAGCLVFNIVVSGTFQGSLTKAYTATIYYPDINTLEDLDESGLYIYTSSPGMMDLFGSGSDDEVINALGRKLCLTEKRKSIKLVAKNRNIASVERYDDAKLLETVTMYGQVHVIPECPRDYHISYIVRVGWPMLPDFDKMISRYIEAGLTFLWFDRSVYEIALPFRYNMTYEDPIFAFDLEDMQTAFYVYTAGLLISINVFLLEIILGKVLMKSAENENNTCGTFCIEIKKIRSTVCENSLSNISNSVRNLWQVDD